MAKEVISPKLAVFFSVFVITFAMAIIIMAFTEPAIAQEDSVDPKTISGGVCPVGTPKCCKRCHLDAGKTFLWAALIPLFIAIVAAMVYHSGKTIKKETGQYVEIEVPNL